jgi:hypothetical protein
MASKVLLVVPEAPVQQAAATSSQRTLGAGKGLRIGTLDNSKSNADHLLAMLIDGMKAQMPVQSVVSLRKPTPSLPAEAAVLDKLAQEADIVISAMAD